MDVVTMLLVSPILWLALCIVLLDAFDISLPRGDSITVSGSLTAAAVFILGPFTALVVGTTSVLLVHFNRARVQGLREAVPDAIARASVTALAAGAAAGIPASDPPLYWLRLLLVPTVLILGETLTHQAVTAHRTGRRLKQLLAGNMRRQGLLVAAEVCVAALTVVLYESMGLWALIPVVAILMLIRQAYAMLLEIRETYHQTLQVLVDAAESTEPGRVGHSERVAAVARELGAGCGLSTPEIERISYAALLHDVNGISDAPLQEERPAGSVVSVVGEAGFLAEVIPVLRVIAGDDSSETAPTEADVLAGFIVALSSDIDASMHEEVARVHPEASISRLVDVPLGIKARAVAAAVAQGFPVPAID